MNDEPRQRDTQSGSGSVKVVVIGVTLFECDWTRRRSRCRTGDLPPPKGNWIRAIVVRFTARLAAWLVAATLVSVPAHATGGDAQQGIDRSCPGLVVPELEFDEPASLEPTSHDFTIPRARDDD